MKQLDKRYRTKYHMSMIENLENIRQNGMEAFLQSEETRWTCKVCGNILCVHRDACPACKC
jgi:rubrerythrin